MLVEYLEGHKQELLRRVESHAAADEGPSAASGRHERIAALVEELIEAVRRGDGSQTRVAADTGDAAVQCRERDLVRLDVIKEVARHSLDVTLDEMSVVSDWAAAADRCRLREGYGRLSDLLDDVDEGAVIVSADGRIEYVNRRFAHQLFDVTGMAQDQFVGKTFAEIGVGPESLARRPQDYFPLARRRASNEQVLRGRWYETKFRAIYSPSGDIAAVTFMSRDIHRSKIAQVRLELLAKLSAMVGSVDYDKVAEALAGVPVPEMADWCVVNLVEDKRFVRTFVAQSDPGKSALRDALLRAAPDWTRNPLWVEMRLTSGFQLLTDVSDEFLRKFALNEQQYRVMLMAGVRSIMVQPVVVRDQIAALLTFIYTTESGRRYDRDDPALAGELALYAAHIIENARLMKDLRVSEARFRVSLAGSKTVVYEQDAGLRYSWGYSPLMPFNVVGKTHEECFSADNAACLTALKRRVLEGEKSVCEDLVINLGGERHIFREAIEPIRDHAGKVVGVTGSATDITEEKQMQQRLSEALGFRDRMMGVLGHDLRNPVTAIRMAAAALLRHPDLPEKLQKKTQVIHKATGRMTEMIETLLDVARVQSFGSLPLSLVATDLGVRVREVVDEAHAAWPDRTIELEMKGDLHGQWDPARVQQAISNLIANALQHGDPRKSVQVSVDGVGTPVLLRVTNEGTPIPSDVMPVLFEPFSRGTSDTSPQGLGLGLYIVRQIAIAHGGTVDVESSTEVGTVFTLLLPRVA